MLISYYGSDLVPFLHTHFMRVFSIIDRYCALQCAHLRRIEASNYDSLIGYMSDQVGQGTGSHRRRTSFMTAAAEAAATTARNVQEGVYTRWRLALTNRRRNAIDIQLVAERGDQTRKLASPAETLFACSVGSSR